MSVFDNQLLSLFSWDIFRQMASNRAIPLCKFNLITNLLTEWNIPYDVSFSSGTRKEAAALQLTIHVNPTTTVVYVVQLEPGSTAFTPSP
jgi:hypothetical protein